MAKYNRMDFNQDRLMLQMGLMVMPSKDFCDMFLLGLPKEEDLPKGCRVDSLKEYYRWSFSLYGSCTEKHMIESKNLIEGIKLFDWVEYYTQLSKGLNMEAHQILNMIISNIKNGL